MDPRFLRQGKLRSMLFCSQDGKCAECGKDLPIVWHADHLTPWKFRQVTNVHEMQALCPHCNLTKGAVMLSGEWQVSPDQQFLRPWQVKLIQLCRAMEQGKQHQILIDVVPAGGKGSVPYLLSAYMPSSVARNVCHVVPRVNLGMQAELPAANLRKYFAAVNIRQPSFRFTQNTTRMLRGNDGYSVCQNSIGLQPDLHCQEFMASGQGPFMFVLDEPQMLPADGVIKKAIEQVRWSKGCAGLVMMSGTPYRGDRKPLPFLSYKKDDKGKEYLDREDPAWQVISYTRKEALENHDILRLEFIKHDATGKLVKGKDTREFASFKELEDYQAQRDGLFAVLSTEGGWKIVEETISDWRLYNSRYPTSQMLIITHSQAQANDYRRRVERNYPKLTKKVYVATSDEYQAAEILKNFRVSQGDILITVGMAYVGFDASRVSHIALLTYYRNRTWIEQALARGVRVDPDIPYGAQRCRAHVPDDPLLAGIIDKIEQEQAEALAKPGPGPGEPVEREFVYGIHSDLTGSVAHELNSIKLDPEMTGFCERLIERTGSSLSRVEMYDAFLQAATFHTDERPYVKEAPQVGVSDMENKLLVRAQKLCAEIDRMRAVPFGTTNGERYAANGRSRKDMTVTELMKELEILHEKKEVLRRSQANAWVPGQETNDNAAG